MNTVTQYHQGNRLLAVFPLVADLAAAAAILVFLPNLSLRLRQPTGWNALLLVVLYIGFCLGVYAIRKLTTQDTGGHWPPPRFLMRKHVRIALGVLFGLIMMFTVAYQFGYLASLQSIRASTLGEGDSSSLFVYAPGAWLGFSMLYILVLAFPVNANVDFASGRYARMSALGLTLINMLLVLAVSQGRAFIEVMQFDASPGVVIVVFVALLLSFGPPRMLYQERQPALPGWLSLFVLIAFATWLIVS